ncbi:MAG: hypothetical protein Q7T26_08225 [Dehalococcoidia bacterium]|nr:hypothetical protein [Dehalococcoidia bacterium]
MTNATNGNSLRPGQEVAYQGRKVYLSDKTTCPVCKRQNFCPSHAYAFIDWYRGYLKRFVSKGPTK